MADVRMTAGPYEFRARWEREKSPKSCEAFGRLLPYRQRFIHVRWSGESSHQLRQQTRPACRHPFLTITDGLENLRPLGEMTLWKGAQDIVFDHG
jgi:hypothetical protein